MAIGTTNFPTSLDTATELVRAANDSKGFIATGGATNSATTINITAVPSSAPADGIAVIVSATDDTVREIVSYTGKTGTTITGVTRNLESSGAKTWLAGDIVYFDTLTALSRTVLVNALIALETKLGVGADTPASGEVLKATGAGASGWSPLTPSDITGLGFTPASSLGPASLQFPEDTDNGANKITVVAPAALAADFTQTLPAADGTVALAPTITVRTDSVVVTNGSSTSKTVTCSAGEVCTGGGYSFNSAASVVIYWNFPSGTDTWNVAMRNNSGASITLTVYAVCAKFGA
jgi:hypothetical protein